MKHCSYLIALVLLCACGRTSPPGPARRVMVLGVDGMDYAMTVRLMKQGRMPNFARLGRQGVFQRLETSVPPLSPVAWSDFMTGMDSGGHGVFDFLRRDPARMVPENSMARTTPPRHYLSLGSWRLPLDSGNVTRLRKGRVFWQTLAEHGVDTTIMRMPANYPPVGAGQRELSGMGTPDLRGSYGLFTWVTTRFGAAREVDGGEIRAAWPKNGVIRTVIHGPPNPFKSPAAAKPMAVSLAIKPDYANHRARITVGDESLELASGKWSGWVPIQFRMLPWLSIPPGILRGMVRFYLRSVQPEVELYVSPVNIDPLHADVVISAPADFARQLAVQSGRFYTQGMAEETKAFEDGVLTREEFFAQAELSKHDSLAQLDWAVEDFLSQRSSFLFYYLGHLDQISHMTWKATDPRHPDYDPRTDPKWAARLEDLYVEIDTLVGRLATKLRDRNATLIVMSDHGFAPWRREFDLNGWLHAHGYLALKDGRARGREMLVDVDWSRTRAYGLGFNGLYLNLQGREPAGTVPAGASRTLLDQLESELLAATDPASGKAAVTEVFQSRQYSGSQNGVGDGPDLIVGYAFGTRNSSASALGAVADGTHIMVDHHGAWSGDHSMDHTTVPGILLSSGTLKKDVTSLRDLSAAVLAEYGLTSSEPAR